MDDGLELSFITLQFHNAWILPTVIMSEVSRRVRHLRCQPQFQFPTVALTLPFTIVVNDRMTKTNEHLTRVSLESNHNWRLHRRDYYSQFFSNWLRTSDHQIKTILNIIRLSASKHWSLWPSKMFSAPPFYEENWSWTFQAHTSFMWLRFSKFFLYLVSSRSRSPHFQRKLAHRTRIRVRANWIDLHSRSTGVKFHTFE